MPRESGRGPRVADFIQRELAMLIQREVKDPRIGMITINGANVSRDLAWADVYFTVLPAENPETAEEILNQASGFLRSRLARALSMRSTPQLRFHYDETIANGARISSAIDRAVEADGRSAALSGSSETALSGSAKTALSGSSETALSGSAETALSGSAKTTLSGAARQEESE